MRTLLFGGALLIAGTASGVAIGAQHTPATHQLSLQLCDVSAAAGGHDRLRDHAAFLAAKLNLTADQRASVERVSTEACAALAKSHEEILALLTPEQRTRLQQLHDDDGGVHAFFKKLHDGR